jgi:hypothetical protein
MAHGGVQGSPFLTPKLDGSEWLASRPSHFTPKESASGTHSIKKLVGPQNRSGLHGEEKNFLPHAGKRTLVV